MVQTSEPAWQKLTPDISPYFEAASKGLLMIKRCADCGRSFFYPRPHCPHCFSASTEWRESAGTGSIYSFTVIRREQSATILAYVALDEGPKMLTNVIGSPPEEVSIGARVKVDFREESNGLSSPVFRLIG